MSFPELDPSAGEHESPTVDTAGRVEKSSRAGDFSIIETVYAAGTELARHSHSHAYLSFILDGQYTEKYKGSSSVCAARTLRFLPSGEVHENSYPIESRCLLIEIEPQTIARLRGHAAVLERPGEVSGAVSAWLANRICTEFQDPDNVSPMAIEGLVLEMLAESARSLASGSSGNVPRWLRRTRDYLHSQFLQPFRLSGAAQVAGVHKVHLVREFRRHFQCTPGDFVRRKRIEHACHLLANSETSLAAIAYTCGFSDQSHFSRVFKRQVGSTPARFREQSASNPMASQQS